MAVAVREVEVAGERFVNLGDVLLVASKSEPGTWHRIDGATCDCKSFVYRGYCRHLKAAIELEAATTDATVAVELTTDFGGGWQVLWHGVRHGGVHSNRADAEGHAQELREAPAWDRAEWIRKHGGEG